MPDRASLYRGSCFPAEVIAHAVRLYLRFALGDRDVEELLAERGIVVSCGTIRAWVAGCGAPEAGELRRRAARPGRTWRPDETAVRLGGQVHRPRRAVDEPGQALDVPVPARRDAAAAERFFRRLLVAAEDTPPARITTDKLRSYAAALARLPARQTVEHLRVRSALRWNDRVEQAHQPTRVRERVTRRVRSAAPAHRFLDAVSRAADLIRPGRHCLTAAAYRAPMGERHATWREAAGLRAA